MPGVAAGKQQPHPPPASAWTHADQAELDVLTWELVDAAFKHRETCAHCQAREPCPRLAEAVEIVAAWARRRLLLTAAEQLRREQDALDRARSSGESAAA